MTCRSLNSATASPPDRRLRDALRETVPLPKSSPPDRRLRDVPQATQNRDASSPPDRRLRECKPRTPRLSATSPPDRRLRDCKRNQFRIRGASPPDRRLRDWVYPLTEVLSPSPPDRRLRDKKNEEDDKMSASPPRIGGLETWARGLHSSERSSPPDMADIIGQLSTGEVDQIFNAGATIGSYTVFPANRVPWTMTLNDARGCYHKIGDRFDLPLECIQRHYLRGDNPLSFTLSSYGAFFDLLEDFRGYVNFFLLQDLVSDDYSKIKFYLPLNSFERAPYPSTVEEYRKYRSGVLEFIAARNRRIDNS